VRAYAAAVADVFRNRELLRLEVGFVCFNGAEWAVWIAMLVYAYEQGGATTAGLVALAQLVPAGLFAPFAAVLADRYRPGRVLALGYVAQAGALGATAVALLADAPPLVAYALAAGAATAVTLTRPAQAALLPSLVRTPEELTATNAVSGWVESASTLVAPALAGVLLAVGSPGLVFATMAALQVVAAFVVRPLGGPRPSAEPSSALSEVAAGFRVLRAARDPRLLVLLLGGQFVAIGALDVLYVVLAIDVLEMGESGAGYLNAAFGAGGVLAIAVTALLVGRRRLVPAFLLGIAVWWLALTVLSAQPRALAAFALLAVAGLGRNLFDVAGRTLLQRVAPPDVLARVFGVLEGAAMAGLALGSVLAPALVALVGPGAAVACVGAILPLVALVGLRRLFRLDAEATVPVVEIALLRSLPLFAPLPPPTVERLARSLEPVGLGAGEVAFREGDAGDRLFVIADGRMDVSHDGHEFGTLGRGDVFGEIALLQSVPRTATLTARTDARLYALDREPFLAAVRADPSTVAEAGRLVDTRLRSLGVRIER
jgi:MFS family permease